MKILVDALAVVEHMTGVSRYAFQLLTHLARVDEKNSYRVLVPSSLSPDHPLIRRLEGCANFSLMKADIPPVGPKRDIRYRALAGLDFDVYHCLNSNYPLGFHYPRGVVTIHDLKYLKYPRFMGNAWWLKTRYLELVFKSAAKRCAKVIAVSHATKRDIVDLFSIPDPDRIVVIHEAGGLFSASSNVPEQGDRILETYGVKRPYFLFLGEHRPHKNIEGVIEAFERFRQMCRDPFHLVITGKVHPSYRARMTRLKWGRDDVVFTGFIPDEHLPVLYRHAYGFLLPSFYEGFGIPILEAMEAGVPVITSNVSSMPEVGGDACLTVSPYDPEDIARKMYVLATDAGLHALLREKGYARAKEFSWEKAARETLKVYEQVGSNS
ncbi:hypothetical protein STHERM_c15670 [Spirochaeta thermophila DSM 6192]|uniref:Glycosyl transferase group 1 n=2 Tax=Winmispira thermophila TaxID=154 RepID=E0RN38_WINT6|nr:hypothetical protein STHERM_c15670 [Spirochaeta thermophila DSM 6192]